MIIQCVRLWFPPRILEKLRFPLFAPPQIEILVSSLLNRKFRSTFSAPNLKTVVSYIHIAVKSTLHQHSSMVCKIYIQRSSIACCRRQIFEELYVNLSLKVPIESFSIPKFNFWKIGFPQFHFYNLSPFWFPHPKMFFQVPPFFEILKIWVSPSFQKGGKLWIILITLLQINVMQAFNFVLKRFSSLCTGIRCWISTNFVNIFNFGLE